jgi:hypothetical protein
MLFSIRAILTRHASSDPAHHVELDSVDQAFGVGHDDRYCSVSVDVPSDRTGAERGGALQRCMGEMSSTTAVDTP